MISKEQFLKETNGGLKFYMWAMEQRGIPLKTKGNRIDNTYNPFYEDSNPSLSFYLHGEEYRFKDHGGNDEEIEYKGDVIDFGAFHYGLKKYSLSELLEKMYRDIKDYEPSITLDRFSPISYQKKKVRKFELKKIEPTWETIVYYNAYKINLYDFPNVSQIEAINYYNESGALVETKKLPKNEIQIAYDYGDFAKIYCPKSKWFWSVGKKPKEYTFGDYHGPSILGEPLFLTGGEKDVMTLESLGYQAICTQSESVLPSLKLRRDIFKLGYQLIVLYDLDKAGRANSKKIAEFGAKVADLSTIVPKDNEDKVKDISDYVKHRLSIDELHKFLRSFYPEEEVSDVVINNIEDESETKDPKAFKDSEDGKYIGIEDWVYDNLPPFFKKVTTPFSEKHERDLVLLSTLPMLSNILPLKGKYMQKTTYPNLFLFVAASASAGKGAMRWANRLIEGIQKGKLADYLKKLEEYEALEDKEKKKTKKPQKQSYLIPGNTSFAAFVQQLSKNEGFGTIVETEADSINNASKHDWGDYSDAMRKSFEFEMISVLRKREEDSFEISDPKLSIVLTGTKNQLATFINSVENGLFSRFMFFMLPLVKKWKNPFEEGIDLEEHFDALSKTLSKFYFLPKIERNVKITKAQQELFNKNLELYQNQLDYMFGEELIASVRRLGSIHFRICMLLTGIRFYDNFIIGKNTEKDDLTCDDIDFEIANKVVAFLISNLKEVYRYLPKPKKFEANLNRSQITLLESVNDEFTFSEFKVKTKELDIAFSTAERHLRKYIKLELVEKMSHGHYRKMKY